MSKKIGVQGDVAAEPGTAFYTGAVSGSWQAGAITLTLHDKIRANKSKAISKATCTFSFTGSDGSKAVSGSEKVELIASQTKLHGQSGGVLLQGDEKVGSTYGNKLKLVATQHKFTSA